MLEPDRKTSPTNPLQDYQTSLNQAAATAGVPVARRPRWRTDHPARPIQPPHQRGRAIRRSLLVVLAVSLVAGAVWFFTTGHGKFSLANLFGSTIKNLLVSQTPIKGQDRGRTNILVYGMTQDGLRTDSIILVSYYWSERKIVTLNIPRDLYVYDGYQNDKMGEVYAYAKARQPKNPSYPDDYVASIISKEYNLPIDYWAELNMQGEVDIVNAIGGIDVTVPDAFTDYQYPTANYSGYVRPAPHFNAGLQHMDGARALIFSRSRHSADNNEGTDFARSKRQQLVIAAIMTKLKAQGVVGNLTEISKYLDILGSNLSTNMTTDEMVSFAAKVKKLDPSADYVKAAWATGNGFLCDSSTAAGAYITLYGVPGNCTVGAGGFKDSKYRQAAIYYVQHLLASGPQAPDDFMTTAFQSLGYLPKPSASPAPAGN